MQPSLSPMTVDAAAIRSASDVAQRGDRIFSGKSSGKVKEG